MSRFENPAFHRRGKPGAGHLLVPWILWSKTKRVLVQAHWIYRVSLVYWAVAFVVGALQ